MGWIGRATGRRVLLAATVCAAGALAVCSGQARIMMRSARSIGGSGQTAGTLVAANDELLTILEQAEKQLQAKDYDRAIKTIQEVLLTDGGFVGASEANRFVSVHAVANALLSGMEPEGLARYRQLYNPQAEQLYMLAQDRNDPSLLRRVARWYLNTDFGPKALDRLGQLHFDGARFSQAAHAWKQAAARVDGEQEGLLLAKTAVAMHLDGDAQAARQLAEDVRKRFGRGKAHLGGRERKLSEFLTEALALAPLQRGGLRTYDRHWPGLPGVPNGLAVMGRGEAILAPRWRYPDPGGKEGWDLLAASGDDIDSVRAMPHNNNYRLEVKPQAGYLLLERWYGNQWSRLPFPALIHPLVMEEAVIVRTDEAVVALDLYTGEVLGSTGSGLPMVREPQKNAGRQVNYGHQLRQIGDNGRYAMSGGDGKVFALGEFRPLSRRNYNPFNANTGQKPEADSSVLVALDLSRQLGLAWSTAEFRHPDEDVQALVRAGKFITAPTYRDGRVFAVAMYLQGYHLLCLDASDGSLVWSAPVSQTPPVRGNYGMFLDPLYERSSSPAVADGKVYVLTNAGVLAAFDAETGQGLWAYQYASDVNQMGRYYNPNQQQAFDPPNPVIVSRGQVLCMPADSESVFAFSAADGKKLWDASRQGQRHLSAIDETRLLLSGPDLVVLAADEKGRVEYRRDFPSMPNQPHGVTGRPAVTPSAALASVVEAGSARVYGLEWQPDSQGGFSYDMRPPLDLVSAEGVLGNLVSLEGKLIAAHSGGVCAYFGFEEAYATLTRRVETASPRERAAALFQRARVSFRSLRYDKSLADALACREALRQRPDSALAAKLKHHLYQTYVHLGNSAATPREMNEWFVKAEQAAVTQRNKLAMKVRRVRCYAAMGDLKRAARMAHDLAVIHRDEELPNVHIGAQADDAVDLGPQAKYYPGDVLAHDVLLREMIAEHGREFYAEFDAQAAEAIQAARVTKDIDAMRSVWRTWPNSKHVHEARFAAAEFLYSEAARGDAAADEDARWSLLNEAAGLLHRVAEEGGEPGRRLSARAGLVLCYAQMPGYGALAGGEAGKAMDFQREHALAGPVAFAGARGALEDLLATVKVSPARGALRRLSASISLPLRPSYSLDGEDVWVVRDQEGRAVRIGQSVVVLQGHSAYLMNTSAPDAKKAMQWRAITSVDPAQLAMQNFMGPGFRLVGGLSSDGQVLLISDRSTMRAFSTASGKALWEKSLTDLNIGSLQVMGTGDGVFVAAGNGGKVACVEIASGDVMWRAQLQGHGKSPGGPPRIRAGMVLLQNDGNKRVTCLSIEDGGRVLGEWAGKNPGAVHAEISPQGLIVLLDNGVLSVRRPGKQDMPLWTRTYKAGGYPVIVAVSAEHIAISPNMREPAIEVLATLGGKEGRVLAEWTLEDCSGQKSVAAEGVFEGGSLYVFSGAAMRMSAQRRMMWGRSTYCHALGIQRFDLSRKAGGPVWSTALDTAGGQPVFPLEPVVGRDHVLLMGMHTNIRFPLHAWILNKSTGTVAEKLDLLDGANDPQARQRRQVALGMPVMTNRQLLVETYDGVDVFGGP